MFDKSFQITRVNNGWMIVLPVHHQYPLVASPGRTDEEIRREIRIAKEEFAKDETIEKINEKQRHLEKEYEQINMIQDNVFVFKTFNEMVAFFKIEFDL